MSVLTSSLLEGFNHGFGTRHAGLTQDAMVSLKQIDSGIVWTADRAAGCLGEGDAIVSDREDAVISIRTADCLPILLADTRSGAVGAVHAGWRGTVAKIVANAVDRMREEFGSKPEDVVAVIGPAIGKCCYQVGADVAAQFGDAAGCIDLAAHNRRQLEAAGVTRIETVQACTYCDPEGRFFSYRREGERAGRMIAYIRARSRV